MVKKRKKDSESLWPSILYCWSLVHGRGCDPQSYIVGHWSIDWFTRSTNCSGRFLFCFVLRSEDSQMSRCDQHLRRKHSTHYIIRVFSQASFSVFDSARNHGSAKWSADLEERIKDLDYDFYFLAIFQKGRNLMILSGIGWLDDWFEMRHIPRTEMIFFRFSRELRPSSC